MVKFIYVDFTTGRAVSGIDDGFSFSLTCKLSALFQAVLEICLPIMTIRKQPEEGDEFWQKGEELWLNPMPPVFMPENTA